MKNNGIWLIDDFDGEKQNCKLWVDSMRRKYKSGAIGEYAGTFFWIILLVVLFITNPKSPSKHISVAKERVERIVQVTDAELNRAVVSSGGYLYRKKSSAEVRKELLSQIRNGDVLNLWFLSIGTYGPCIMVRD